LKKQKKECFQWSFDGLNDLISKKFNYIKIYSTCSDGWNIAKFHSVSDKIGPTIVVAKSKSGQIFGG